MLVLILGFGAVAAWGQQVNLPAPPKILPATTKLPDETHLRVETVLESVEKHYPPLRAALLDLPIAEADYLAAQGRFDLAIKSIADTNSFGFYESRRWDVGLDQPLSWWGANLFSGYQVSNGSYPSYEGKNQTNGLGEYRAGMRLPLFRDRALDGRRADLAKTNLGRRVADLGVQQQKLAVIQAATTRYWAWVAAGRRFEVARAILQIAVDRDKILERAVELGQLPRFEVLDNRRIVEQRRSQFVQFRRALEQAALDLSLFYRDDRGGPRVAVSEQLPPSFPEPEAYDERQLDRDIETALQRRPEIGRLEAQRSQVEVDRNLARNRRLPGVDFLLSYDRELGAQRVQRGPSELRAGVSFDLPLQRRTATGQLRAAESRISQFNQRRDFARDQVITEVRDAASALKAAFEGARVLRDEVAATQQVEDAERTRYQLGESTLFILNQRELQTADAAVREASALADYYRARALYEQAIAAALR
jgi:outer membrane protein TolC